MKPITKIKISNLTTWIMIITIVLIGLWFIGFVVSNTFDLNVFTRRTTEFFFSIIGFAFVLVACSAILNISLNISLIADSKVQELKVDSKPTINKKFLYLTGLIVIFLIGFLFVGDYLSRQNEKNKLVNEVKDILDRYDQSIEEISLFLQDTSKIGEIPDILKFLSNQKEEFPTITLLTSDKYKGELVFLEIKSWSNEKSLKEAYYGNSFYKCKKEDCEYLQEIFETKSIESFLWTEKNNYKFYFPVDRNEKKFIVLFSKYKRYGKIGSY